MISRSLTLAFLIALGLMQGKLVANPLKIELVSAVESIQPGVPVQLALHLKHKEHYHSYWKFPGIVGVATGVKWKLPEGWTAAPIEWPEPKRVNMFEIRAQGLRDEQFLPVTLTPPKDLPVGQKVTLVGDASWMCCHRDCNPGYEELSITLPVSAEPASPNKKWAGQIAETKAELPKNLQGWKATATREDKKVTLKITPLSDGAKQQAEQIKEILFFTDDGAINSDGDQVLKKNANGSFSLELQVSEYAPKPFPKTLSGLVQTPQSWSPQGPKSANISPAFQ